MGYRNLLVTAVITAAFCGFTGIAESSFGETVAVDNGIAVKDSDVTTPGRGMTMDQVAAKFGAPTNKLPAVGQPPISRWDYPGFIVYFERNYVIHSVVANS
jgi:outer membrane protein assembly factor BamE (lipoprotein component of BamABCDE complex)